MTTMTEPEDREDAGTVHGRRGRPPGHSGAAEREAAVLALLETHPGGMTRNEIARALGEDRSRVWLALSRLKKAEKVRTCAPVPVTAVVDGATRKLGTQVVWAAGRQCPE